MEEYRLGTKACADGNFAEAFERFDRNGFLRENGADYLKMAAKRFVGLYHREQVIAVAPTHRECDALTAEIRARLPLGKIVQTLSVFRSAHFSRARLRNPKTYHPGQTVMFVRRMKNIAEAGTITEIVKVERNSLYLSNGKKASSARCGGLPRRRGDAPDGIAAGGCHLVSGQFARTKDFQR